MFSGLKKMWGGTSARSDTSNASTEGTSAGSDASNASTEGTSAGSDASNARRTEETSRPTAAQPVRRPAPVNYAQIRRERLRRRAALAARKRRAAGKSSHKHFEAKIRRVLKEVHPKMRIKADSLKCVSDVLYLVGLAIGRCASELRRARGLKTIGCRDIQCATRLLLPGELAKHAVSEGTKAVTKFTSVGGGGSRRRSIAAKSGLIMVPSKFRNMLKKECHNTPQVSQTASVYLAAVGEYIVAEVLELAGNSTRDNKKKTLRPRDLVLGVWNDEELSELLCGFQFHLGGVPPGMQMAVTRHMKRKRTMTSAQKWARKKKLQARNQEAARLGLPAVRPVRRSRPGMKQLRLCRKLQKEGKPLGSNAAWKRSLKEALLPHAGMSVVQGASQQLRAAAETHLVKLLQSSLLSAIHSRRISVMPKDIHSAKGGNNSVHLPQGLVGTQ